MIAKSSNGTALSISTVHLLSSSHYTSMIYRLLIVFGSISFLWLIMGIIFAFIQTFRPLKKKIKHKLFRYHRSLPPSLPSPYSSSSLMSIGKKFREHNRSDIGGDIVDDQTSVFTSASFISEQSKSMHEHVHFVPFCEPILEESIDLMSTTSNGISNMAYNQSISASTHNDESFLAYSACRNFAYSQSTLASSVTDINTSIPSVIIPINETSISKSMANRLVDLKRHSSQSSTTTTFSQLTNATYLSSSSAPNGRTTTSIKLMPLPTVMITDCDRLQTDIIELNDFEPEKDWRRIRPELRSLLNDKMPEVVR